MPFESSHSKAQVNEELVSRTTAMVPGSIPTFDANGKLIDSGKLITEKLDVSAYNDDKKNPLKFVNNRAPKQSDRLNKSYDTNALWQYAGQIWKPFQSDNTSAAWQVQPVINSKPADLLGAAAKFAGGTVCLKNGYVGGAIDISIKIATVDTTFTINILPNGTLDNNSVFAALSQQDAGDFVKVTKIYDQTGNANHFVLAAPYAALSLLWDITLNGFAICPQDNTNGTTARGLQIPNTLSLNGNNYAFFVIGRAIVSADNSQGIILNIGDYSGGTPKSLVWSTSASGNTQKWTTEQGSRTPPTPQPYDCSETVFSLAGDATGTYFGRNEEIIKNTSFPTSQVYTGGWLGNFKGAPGYLAVRTTGIIICDSAPTTALQLKVRQSIYCLFNFAPQRRDKLVFIGDSRMAAFKTQYKASIPYHAREQIKRPISIYNFGNGSQTAENMITTTAVTAAALVDPNNVNICCVLAGVNDYIVNARTPAQVVAFLKTMCTNLKTVGYKTILIAELYHSNATLNTWLNDVRNLIIADPTIADYICNVATFTAVASPGNVNFYPDGIHIGDMVTFEIGAAVADIVDNILAS
jgi:hypothetical protein